MQWIMSQKSKLLNLALSEPQNESVALGKWTYYTRSFSSLICENEKGELQSLWGAFQLKDSKNQRASTISWSNIFIIFGYRKQIQLSRTSLVRVCLFTPQLELEVECKWWVLWGAAPSPFQDQCVHSSRSCWCCLLMTHSWVPSQELPWAEESCSNHSPLYGATHTQWVVIESVIK